MPTTLTLSELMKLAKNDAALPGSFGPFPRKGAATDWHIPKDSARAL